MKRIIAAIVLLPVIIFLFFGFSGKTEQEILNQVSDDGIHSLRIVMVGDPEFPFGNTNCRAELYTERSRTAETEIVLKNDGKTADSGNFSVEWKSDCVQITAYAEEMDAAEYTLYFR